MWVDLFGNTVYLLVHHLHAFQLFVIAMKLYVID